MDYERDRERRRSRSRSREKRRHHSSHPDKPRRRSRSRSRSRERRHDRRRSRSADREVQKSGSLLRHDEAPTVELLPTAHPEPRSSSTAASSILHATDLYAVRDGLASGPAVPSSAAAREEDAALASEPRRSKWDDEPPARSASAPAAEAPNFGLSGALAADVATGNVLNGITLKFSEPAEARVPSWKWHFRIFKGDEMIEKPLYVHRQSAYLFGRERKVADIPTDHPSCSSQHAVLQYRLVALPGEPGSMAPPQRTVKPYIMDLESTNGTFLNGVRLEGARYVELRPGDVLRFGLSSRDYVLMHDEMAAAAGGAAGGGGGGRGAGGAAAGGAGRR